MTHQRSWDIPDEQELEHASRCFGSATSWFATLTPFLQAIAIPFLAALLFLGR